MSLLASQADLEAAASVFEAAGSPSSGERRAAAEAALGALERAPDLLRDAPTLILATTSPFLVSQLVAAVRRRMLREWAVLETGLLRELYAFLAGRLPLVPPHQRFLRNEILQSLCSLLKRGWLDERLGAGAGAEFLALSDSFVAAGDAESQSLGCQLLLTLCTEFCSAWRTGALGLTWDFHATAKRAFEKDGGLLEVFRRALRLLGALRPALAEGQAPVAALAHQLLTVAETALTWTFGAKHVPRRFSFAQEFQPSASFRPPPSWRAFLLDEAFQPFLFQLHASLKPFPQLREQATRCLGHLCSLNGPVFSTGEGSHPNDRNGFVSVFVRHLCQGLGEPQSPREVHSLALLLGKLVTYQHYTHLRTLPETEWVALLGLMERVMVSELGLMMRENMGAEAGDEVEARAAADAIADAWANLVRLSKPEDRPSLQPPARRLTEQVFRTFLSPPIGSRPPPPDEEAQDDGDEATEDRETFAPFFGSFRTLARLDLDQSLECLAQAAHTRLTDFSAFISHNQGSAHERADFLQAWQEDSHWLLIMIGALLTDDDIHNPASAPHAVMADLQLNLPEASRVLEASIRSPAEMAYAGQPSPWLRLLATSLTLASVQLNLSRDEQLRNYLSPQLWSTTLWLLRRVVAAFSFAPPTPPGSDSSPESLSVSVSRSDPPPVHQLFWLGSDLSRLLLEFSLGWGMRSLELWSGEASVGRDAVGLLLWLAESRQAEAAASDTVAAELASLRLANLPPAARRGLVSAFVSLTITSPSPAQSQALQRCVLQPLMEQYAALGQELVKGSGGVVAGQMCDLVDCFAGMAEAANSQSAEALLGILRPVLEGGVELIGAVPEEIGVVSGVLGLFRTVVHSLARCVVDASLDSVQDLVQSLLEVYGRSQTNRLQTKTLEEEQAGDVVKVLELLNEVGQRDLWSGDGEATALRAKGAIMAGLNLLGPLLSQRGLLSFPSVAKNLFSYVAFVAELFPEALPDLGPDLFRFIFAALAGALESRLGTEPMYSALQFIASAVFRLSKMEGSPRAREICAALAAEFLSPVFQLCLAKSCELEGLAESALALHNLIAADWELWLALQRAFCARLADAEQRSLLANHFRLLCPAPPSPQARLNRAFRERLETGFIEQVQGLLVLPDPAE